jgi:hypothetical protein
VAYNNSMRSLIIFLLIFSQLALAKGLKRPKGWKYIYAKDGLSFYSKQGKGGLLKFRARGILNVKPLELMAILRNVELATQWDKDTKTKVTIKNISDVEANTYSVTKIPWPFKDRDMVLNNILRIDEKRMSMRVDVNSVNLKSHPNFDSYVRANLSARFYIRPHENKNFSYVDIKVLVDPRGNIPTWIVNMVQESMPYDFLKSLESYSKTVNIKPNKGVKKMYKEYLELYKNREKVSKF